MKTILKLLGGYIPPSPPGFGTPDLGPWNQTLNNDYLCWWLRTSSKFNGQEFEEIRWNIESSKTSTLYKFFRTLTQGNERCLMRCGDSKTNTNHNRVRYCSYCNSEL